MTMKVLNFPTMRVYVQCPFYEESRCLVTVNGFANNDDAPLIHTGFYVPRRGVEGGIAWEIDVLPRVQTMVEELDQE
jgi:hypothetical protein